MDPETKPTTQTKLTQNKTVQHQKQQQQQQMTPQLATELVTLMADPTIQVKYSTMNAILQYTKLQKSKQLFLNTDLFKLVVQCINNEQLHKLALSTLIHFSSSQACGEKMIQFVQPVVMDLRKSSGLIEELGLLFLLNVSRQYDFTAKLLDKTQKQQTAQRSTVLLQIIYSFLQSKPSRRWVIANVFVNISSHDVGREYVAKQKIYLTFLKYINDEKQALRLASLRIIRNVCFLWENDEVVTELLKKQNYLIDNLAIHILIMLTKSKLVDQDKAVKILKQTGYNNILDYDMEIEPDLQKIVTSKQKSINQIQICIDAIIILSNADFPKRKPEFLKQQLKQVIALVNFAPISEDSKDKLEALETFCFW